MEEDGDDDIYATEKRSKDAVANQQEEKNGLRQDSASDEAELDESDDEGEDEDSDSDIDIITEQKDEPRKSTAKPNRVIAVKDDPLRPPSVDPVRKSPAAAPMKAAHKGTPPRLGASYPAPKTSTVDVDATPIYEPSGKVITEVSLDTDVPEDDKAWRRPGSDMSDYFNYGFDEFTWASYCLKQNTLRQEVSQSKKQMEDMQSFLGVPGGTTGAMGVIPGASDFPPEMMQMMNQMMAQGVNPQEVSPEMFMQQMMQNQGGGGGIGQSFAAGQAYGQQGQSQQQMSFNYGGAGGGRNQGGRGRRNW